MRSAKVASSTAKAITSHGDFAFTDSTNSSMLQLLEIMGAMGLREVRRMRGEMGRAMFMLDLEAEAFAGVDGYERA